MRKLVAPNLEENLISENISIYLSYIWKLNTCNVKCNFITFYLQKILKFFSKNFKMKI